MRYGHHGDGQLVSTEFSWCAWDTTVFHTDGAPGSKPGSATKIKRGAEIWDSK